MSRPEHPNAHSFGRSTTLEAVFRDIFDAGRTMEGRELALYTVRGG